VTPIQIGRLRSRGIAIAATLPMLVTGCGMIQDQMDPGRVSVSGVKPTVEQINFAGVAAAQDRLIRALQDQAQLSGVTLSYQDPRWSLVMKAGIQLVNGQCDQYLDALFRFNREQRAARQGLTGIGAATAAIMGLTDVAGIPIAIVATAFGLASTLFDAGVNSVLFQVEPSALRNIVVQGRQAYLDVLDAKTNHFTDIDTRPDAMIALQGYLTQCSPAAIEANINNAANGSPFAVTNLNVKAGTQQFVEVATGTPAVTLVGRPFAISEQPAQPPKATPSAGFQPPHGNLLPCEKSLTAADIRRAQAALGVTATGDPGPAGSAARRSIEEFQNAMRARDGNWPNEDIGTLCGPRTRETLISIGPTPSGFHTAFERFFLGNAEDMRISSGGSNRAFSVPDPTQMKDLRDRLGLPPTPPTGSDWWDGVRPALAKKRIDFGLPGRDELDSTLYARIKQ
jgi:hypothetical protein